MVVKEFEAKLIKNCKKSPWELNIPHMARPLHPPPLHLLPLLQKSKTKLKTN